MKNKRKRKDLDISKEIKLPANAGTQKLAFLGMPGSGKTYGAGVLVEQLLLNETQTVIWDTVGNWGGLRSSASGKRKGFEIPILGGDRGDISLDPSSGKMVAEIIVETRSSMIIDISEMTLGEQRRFVCDNATTLLALKKRSPSPLETVWEECQDLLPQIVRGDQARALGAVQRLIKIGRNYGVGCVLISQRPAAVNKEVLNLCETVFAFRTTGKHDRKAIADWVTTKAEPAIDLLDRITKLESGTCICWSPSWLKRFELIHINRKSTFDSTATPDFDDETVARKLAPVDLAKFEKRMAEAIVRAKENDPAALKAEIATLKKMLSKPNAIGSGADAGELDALRERVASRDATIAELRARKPISKSEVRAVLRAIQDFGEIADRMAEISTKAAHVQAVSHSSIDGLRLRLAEWSSKAIGELRADPARSLPGVTSASVARSLAARESLERGIAAKLPKVSKPEPSRRTSTAPAAATPNDGSLQKIDRAMLTALAEHPDGLTRKKLRIYTGYADSGPTSKAMGRIVTAGWVQEHGGGKLAITRAGLAALGPFDPLPKGHALYEQLLAGNKLNTCEKKMLTVIHDAWPNSISRPDIRMKAGYADSGPTSKAMGHIVGLDYVDDLGRDGLRISSELIS